MTVPDRHIKERDAKPKPLFVGPWYGEFGHEVMFAAMARAYAEGYKRVIACSRAGSRPFYADFAHEFVAHDIAGEPAMAGTTHETAPDPASIARWVPPTTEVHRFPGHTYRGNAPIVPRRYGRQVEREDGMVVVHARLRPHVPQRNWAQGNWNRLARRMLGEGVARRLVCIGTKASARMIEGALDMRDAPLDEQMDVGAAAQFAVGPSSGPMHLLQHCECPVVVWCGGGEEERVRTARRYLSDWNPFGTPAHAYEYASWQPSVETVWDWLLRFLLRIAPELVTLDPEPAAVEG